MANMWMVRAGENAFLIDDFKQDNIVAIGWEIGDLAGKTPDEIKEIMARKYPDASKTSLGLNSGQVIRFVCDFQIGDWVISYNHHIRKYLVGKITSDYYFSSKLADKYNKPMEFYPHFRDVEWIGEVKRDDLSDSASKSLKSIMTVFYLNDSAKNSILYSINSDEITWPEFYMEFADKLLEYKNNRAELINKIQRVFNNLNINLPTLENDDEGNAIVPVDIDPFTVFALFNKQISAENRMNISNQIKKEFSLKSDSPITFYGIAAVNNLGAAFYGFKPERGEKDIDNLWELFSRALEFANDKNSFNREHFINAFDIASTQYKIKWNITMALNWIRPFDFIGLDQNNRDILSNEEIFSEEFKEEIKSLKTPPKGEQYLKICEEVKSCMENSGKFNSFPDLSHNAYVLNRDGSTGDSEGIGDNDVRSTRYWLISPGQGAYLWDEFYENGEIGIGFDGTGDLKQYESKEEIKLKFQEIYNDKGSHKNNVHACWQFVHDMQIGDVVFVKKGWNGILGRGIVESDYEYDESKPYHKIRKVRWTHRGYWENEDKLPMKTLTDITYYQEFVNKIKNLFVDEGEDDEPSEGVFPEYNEDKFLNEVYIAEEEYHTLVKLLENKKNLIIEGAPGVGKTFMAKRLAYSMMGEKNTERVMMVQFHQSYSYEDFVMGYRPYKDGFELKQGSFYEFCKKAEEDSDNDYFFIIDEINRGNLSKIFGELFMLIENDKRGDKNRIRLVYSNELFYIPKNVHIIGLMNTADRSLAMIDYALRRRFAFFDLKPGFASDGFKDYQSDLSNETFDNLILAMEELNEAIRSDESLGEGFRIGHSYLCNIKPDEVEEKLQYIVEYELIPLLKEYWFDETENIAYWSDRLRSVIND